MKTTNEVVKVKALCGVCIGVGTYLKAGEIGTMDKDDANYLVASGQVTLDLEQLGQSPAPRAP
jgi:hypothetical protein